MISFLLRDAFRNQLPRHGFQRRVLIQHADHHERLDRFKRQRDPGMHFAIPKAAKRLAKHQVARDVGGDEIHPVPHIHRIALAVPHLGLQFRHHGVDEPADQALLHLQLALAEHV